jgi:hypothetical protein
MPGICLNPLSSLQQTTLTLAAPLTCSLAPLLQLLP